MIDVGPELEGPKIDETLAPCPFCTVQMVTYASYPDTAFHPLGIGCFLDGRGVNRGDRDKWNRRLS